MFKKKIKHEKKIINDTKEFFLFILKSKNEYTYISNQKNFEKILKQKDDKIFKKIINFKNNFVVFAKICQRQYKTINEKNIRQ